MLISLFFGMLLVGAGVGVLNGALGVGGGLLMVPALLEFVPGMQPHTAKGTSLFIIIFVAGFNAWRQNRGQPVPWGPVGLLAVGSIAGGYAGAWATGFLSGEAVVWIFVGLIGLVGLRLILSDPQPIFEGSALERAVLAVAIGVAAGVTSGMTGIGGGLVLVPLVLLARISTNDRVTGLSNLVMVATSAAGALAHLLAAPEIDLPWTVGQVSLAVAPAIYIGAMAGSPAGRRINVRLTYRQRKLALLALIVVIGARMAWRALAYG